VKRMHVVEEEVPGPTGPPITVLSKGRGCHIAVDDNDPVPSLVSSSLVFFLKSVGDSSHPFFINAVDL
jgi:hypothetical protein